MPSITRLMVKDFCCIKELDLNLKNIGLVQIVGQNKDSDAAISNGSGKTSIFKAITWCLYHDTLDKDKYDEVIRYGAKSAYVELHIEDGKNTWKVKRERLKKKPLFTLLKNDVEWQDEPQQKVIDLLGLDFNGFCNSILYGQGSNISRFFSATDTQRKEMLHRILRTEIYRKAEKEARRLHSEKEKQLEKLENDMAIATQRIGDLGIDKLKELKDGWLEGNKADIEEAVAEAKRLIEESKSVAVDDNKRQQLEDRITSIDKEIEEQKKLLEKKKNLEKEKEVESRGYPELLSDVKSIGREIHAVDDILENLDGDECFVCKSPLNAGAGFEYKIEQEAKKQKLIAKKQKLSKKLSDQENRVRSIDRQLNELRYVTTELQNNTNTRNQLERQIDSLAAEAEKQVAILKEKARGYLDKAKRLQKATNPYTDQLKNGKNKQKEFEQSIADSKQAFKDAIKGSELLNFWVGGFGGQGLPSLLLDSVMAYLTQQMNHYLRKLTDGDIVVDITTQKELKTKKDLRDEINIALVIEGIPGATPSSGQKKKLDIASDLALMDLVATREDSDLDILLMDEVLDGLDAEGVNRVIDLLSELRQERSSILVITHEAGLTEAFFDKVITITKENGASTVRCSV